MRFIVAIMDGGWIGFRGAINDWDWSNLKVDLQITRVVKGGGRVRERESTPMGHRPMFIR